MVNKTTMLYISFNKNLPELFQPMIHMNNKIENIRSQVGRVFAWRLEISS